MSSVSHNTKNYRHYNALQHLLLTSNNKSPILTEYASSWRIPGDIPKTTVDDDNVRFEASDKVCNDCLHVWTVDTRDKVEP